VNNAVENSREQCSPQEVVGLSKEQVVLLRHRQYCTVNYCTGFTGSVNASNVPFSDFLNVRDEIGSMCLPVFT
jgi:hypothetical protein